MPLKNNARVGPLSSCPRIDAALRGSLARCHHVDGGQHEKIKRILLHRSALLNAIQSFSSQHGLTLIDTKAVPTVSSYSQIITTNLG